MNVEPQGEWAKLAAKLTWLYGSERTLHIFAGCDSKTNDDLAKWRKLGKR